MHSFHKVWPDLELYSVWSRGCRGWATTCSERFSDSLVNASLTTTGFVYFVCGFNFLNLRLHNYVFRKHAFMAPKGLLTERTQQANPINSRGMPNLKATLSSNDLLCRLLEKGFNRFALPPHLWRPPIGSQSSWSNPHSACNSHWRPQAALRNRMIFAPTSAGHFAKLGKAANLGTQNLEAGVCQHKSEITLVQGNHEIQG